MRYFPSFCLLFLLIVILQSPAHAQLGGLFGGPKVKVISTDDLSSMIEKRQEVVKKATDADEVVPPADFVVVDVRSEEETDVSMIPGAITKKQYEQEREKYDGRLVIPYCTIGGRSGNYASRLAKDGTNVKNFKGSILDWVKQELPLVTKDGEPTNRVHTYSDRYKVPAKYEQVTK